MNQSTTRRGGPARALLLLMAGCAPSTTPSAPPGKPLAAPIPTLEARTAPRPSGIASSAASRAEPAASAAPSASEPPTPAPAPAAAVDPKAVSLSARALPAGLVVDGDVAEWGQLGPEKSDAPSHIAVGLANDGATFAGELAPAVATKGIWLGLTFGVPFMMGIGELQRSGGVNDFGCVVPYSATPLPPAQAAECKAVHERADAFRADQTSRFVRFYRVGAAGVKRWLLGGATSADAKARLVWKARPNGGATFELHVEALGLPLATSAPIDHVGLYVSTDDAAPHEDLPRDACVPAPQKLIVDRFYALIARPNVKAEIEKYGRIESFPFHSNNWGGY